VRRLLYYLYGPGRANEHTDPHLVAGFGDPAELEPERRRDGSRDFRRLAGLLAQPLAALAGPGLARPVWHCAVRAAPGDRILSDAEWAEVAGLVMERTGLAPADDDFGVRWVAVRHAADHVHIVATLARQDGTRPRVWNDFYRVREACQAVERRFGLAGTAPADRTAARRASRAETEQAARRGWDEVPRVRLRREVCAAAAGAGDEPEFFARLAAAGVLVRQRRSVGESGGVTGYAVGLAEHRGRGGGVIWYGGGKLAADLTLPKLRARWTGAGAGGGLPGAGWPAGAVRAALRNTVAEVAGRAGDEQGFFAGLREAGLLVRLRFSDADPGQVTGYSVALPGHGAAGGVVAWHGGGRLAAGLSLPRLRRGWQQGRSGDPGRSGTAGLTAPERNAIYEHAARQAGMAAAHVRRCAGADPGGAADAAWAAADALHMAAQALGSPALRQAAEAYDRAARAPYGRLPRRTGGGQQLRVAARVVGLLGRADGAGALVPAGLLANLAGLAAAVAELRRAQRRAAQASAARAAAAHLNAELARIRSRPPGQARSQARHPRRSAGPPPPHAPTCRRQRGGPSRGRHRSRCRWSPCRAGVLVPDLGCRAAARAQVHRAVTSSPAQGRAGMAGR
jgi:hypothetical protein